MLLYADDLVILSDSPGDLQRKLVLLESYSALNKLEVNIPKTKIVCFRRSPRAARNMPFLYAGNVLEVAKSYNYLGVIFSSSSLFYEMTLNSVHRAAMSTGSVISLMARSKMISWESRMKLYESMVLNSVSHCISAWGLRYPTLLERGQVRFFKSLLHLPRCTPDFAVRLETGVTHLSFLLFKCCLSWLEKLLFMGDDRLPRLCFNRLRQLQNTDFKYNWSRQVEQFFTLLQKRDLWNGLCGHSLRRSKADLLTSYREYLHFLDVSAASASTFLVFPSLLRKVSPNPAVYLTWNLPMYIVRLLAQIRLTNIRGVSFSSRGNSFYIDSTVLCSICNLQKRETLFHIFSECPVYRPVRSELISSLFADGSPNELMSADPRRARQIAHFVTAMLRIRAFIINE